MSEKGQWNEVVIEVYAGGKHAFTLKHDAITSHQEENYPRLVRLVSDLWHLIYRRKERD